MEEGRMVRIDRESSIESEPRTLNMDQIQHAREAALFVMETMSIEEAMHIFTQGLEPVVNAAGDCGGVHEDWDWDWDWDMDEEEMRYAEDQLRIRAFRDVASAPF